VHESSSYSTPAGFTETHVLSIGYHFIFVDSLLIPLAFSARNDGFLPDDMAASSNEVAIASTISAVRKSEAEHARHKKGYSLEHLSGKKLKWAVGGKICKFRLSGRPKSPTSKDQLTNYRNHPRERN